jgi:hypothetical protein
MPSIVRCLFLTIIFLIPLCGGCSSPTSPSAAIVLSTTTVTFPATAVGDTATATVTLSTTSDQTIGLADSDTADFPYSTTCAASLPAGSTCSIALQFHPSAVGNLQAWLLVNSVSGKPLPIALTGTATGTPAALNPGSPISLLQIITTEPNPFYLEPGQTGQLSASAISTSGGAADVTALAAWTSSDPNVASVSPSGLVTATGGGTAGISVAYLGHFASIRVLVVGLIAVTPTAFLFPPTSVGQTSSSPAFSVTFSGGPNMIGSMSSSDPNEFSVVNTTCDETLTHAAGFVCTLSIGFSPAAPGKRTAQFSITSAQSPTAAPATLILTGIGQ